MNATGKRRLLKLADFLENMPRNKAFDMSVIASNIDAGQPACGSSACAIGWATAIPSFRRAGLRLNQRGRVRHGNKRCGGAYTAAAKSFFSLDFGEATHLFGDNWLPSAGLTARKNAVKRIRKFVAQQDADAKANKRRGSAKRA